MAYAGKVRCIALVDLHTPCEQIVFAALRPSDARNLNVFHVREGKSIARKLGCAIAKLHAFLHKLIEDLLCLKLVNETLAA